MFETLFSLYMRKPDEKKARIILAHWRSALPGDFSGYLCAARFYTRKGEFSEAIKQYSEALSRQARRFLFSGKEPVFFENWEESRKLSRITTN